MGPGPAHRSRPQGGQQDVRECVDLNRSPSAIQGGGSCSPLASTGPPQNHSLPQNRPSSQ